jgi:archaellum component FlaC
MSDLLMMSLLRDMQTEIKSMSRQLADVQKDVQEIKQKLTELENRGDSDNG